MPYYPSPEQDTPPLKLGNVTLYDVGSLLSVSCAGDGSLIVVGAQLLNCELPRDAVVALVADWRSERRRELEAERLELPEYVMPTPETLYLDAVEIPPGERRDLVAKAVSPLQFGRLELRGDVYACKIVSMTAGEEPCMPTREPVSAALFERPTPVGGRVNAGQSLTLTLENKTGETASVGGVLEAYNMTTEPVVGRVGRRRRPRSPE